MSINKRCIITIPVYKRFDELSSSERASFVRVCRIMHSWEIVLVTHKNLSLDPYFDCAYLNNINIFVEYFKETYFSSILGYNDLMLSADYYRRFRQYDYMLIYQLDAWIFSDELEQWCNRGYDYVGAPWFDNCGSYEDGCNLWAVGNGGLSLRRISFFIDLLSYKGPLYVHIDLSHGFVNFVKSIIKSFGYHNTLSWQKSFRRLGLNEDTFLMVDLRNMTNIKSLLPKTPLAIEALGFAFEKSPSYLFNLNGNKLPFGCHAWEKYEYDSFWNKFIKDENIYNNNKL